MNNKVLYLALGVAVLGATSCNKKLGDFQASYFNANPTPLETVGLSVPAVITGNIPAKFMVKNAKVTATPVLEYSTGSTQGTPVVIQGENVRANGQVISYNNGGTVQIPFNTLYSPEMAQSNLYLNFLVEQGNKTYELPRVLIDSGIIATSTLASAEFVIPAAANHGFEKEILSNYSAEIMFLINQAVIRQNQIDAADYVDLNKRLIEANQADNQEITGINIFATASPDGTYAFNEALAERREEVTAKYMENQLKKDKISNFGEIVTEFTPEDWEGFQKLIEESNIQDKDLILSVLKMYSDPNQREEEIRNMASVYGEIESEIMPKLRYSKIRATIKTIGKSDEELIELFEVNPSTLTESELLYTATLENDKTKRAQMYEKIIQLFPNSYRAVNNLGMVQYEAGNYAAAKSNFEKAKRMNPSAKEVQMNLGLIEMLNGNYASANELIGAAAGVPEAADALGVYYLTQGDVNKANNAFGSVKNNNSALAKILNKDYTSAQSILNSIPNPDATTYYLNAILGARTNNEGAVLSNLKKAISLDNSMLNKAKNDLEFASYNLNSL